MHNKHNADIVLGCDTNQSSKSTRRRTCAMANFLSEFSLNTILENDEPTFHHNNLTSESQIDHILYCNRESSRSLVKLSEHLCLKNNPTNLSSHDVIVGKIMARAVPSSKSGENYTSTYTPFLVKKPLWSEDGLPGYQSQTTQVQSSRCSAFALTFRKSVNIHVRSI